MTYGRQARNPNQLKEVDNLVPDRMTANEYIEEMIDKFREAYGEVRHKEEIARRKCERYLLKKRIDHDFKVNDLVLVYIKQYKKGHIQKLMHPWKGPYRIKEFVTPVTVRLEL